MPLDIKPVIFLAFANDRSGKEGYLTALKKERNKIENILQVAAKEGICEVVIEEDATPEDIFKIFNQYSNRITIFHYSGHGSKFGLHLNTEDSIANKTAGSAGLAQLFGTEENLKLIFLNACSTNGQTLEIKQKTKSNVITTLRTVRDDVATDFAVQFYQAIAAKDSLQKAYNKAVGFIKKDVSEVNSVEAKRKLYRGLDFDAMPNEFPWQIEGDSLDWNLLQGGAILGDRPEIDVFVAYAPADEHYQKKLQKHLALLKRFKIIKTFSEVDITAGRDIKKGFSDNLGVLAR